MVRKDYYLILNVTRGEHLRRIREAFRELAKKYHSARAGPDATHKFQDPEKRKTYNHELEQEELRTYSRPAPTFPHPQPDQSL
jgi:DnaJ-class molecular chaperone